MRNLEEGKSIREVRGVDIHPAALFGRAPETGSLRVREIARLAAECKLNFLRPFVVGVNCDASYNSRILPTKLFEEWDPLEILIEEAHARGLEVHPFVCVVPQGADEIGLTLRNHPEWAMVDKEGKTIGWGNPAHPKFREFAVSIVAEIAKNYDVDGISLDYLRYPDANADYSEYSRNSFRERFDADPLQLTEETPLFEKWNQWRIAQIETLTREIYGTVRRVRADAVVSAYVWTVLDPQICLRDWEAWLRKGYLDAINPTGYVYDFSSYMHRIRASIAAAHKAAPEVPAFVNIGVSTSHGSLKDAIQIVQWTQGAREAGAAGVSFFTMESLLPFLKEVSQALFKGKASVPRRVN